MDWQYYIGSHIIVSCNELDNRVRGESVVESSSEFKMQNQFSCSASSPP